MKFKILFTIALLATATLTYAETRCVSLIDAHVSQQTLDLSSCDLHPDDLGYIENYLEAHPAITSLNVNNNQRLFSKDNAKVLQSNISLKEIKADNTMLYASTENVIHAISGISTLTALSVENDRLNDTALRYLSDNATHLTDLDIADNDYISENALYAYLRNNRVLQKININNLPLSKRILFTLGVFPNYTDIAFGNQTMETIDDGLMIAFSTKTSLNAFEMKNITLTPVQFDRLLKNKHITKLGLRNMKFNPYYCTSLINNPNLTVLDMSTNAWFDDRCLKTVSALPLLNTLILDDHVGVSFDGFQNFANHPNLKTLVVEPLDPQGNPLNFAKIKSLHSLTLHFVFNVDDALLKSLAGNENLTELVFVYSRADKKPIDGLEALEADTHLKKLGFVNTGGIVDDAVAVALSKNKNLEVLNLARNKLTDAILDAFKKSSLKKLILNDNKFDPYGDAATSLLAESTIPTIVLENKDYFSSKK